MGAGHPALPVRRPARRRAPRRRRGWSRCSTTPATCGATWSTVPTEADDDEAFKVRQSDPGRPDRFDDFIASLDDHDAPRLDFLHVLLPHQPWRHLPSGARHNGEFIAEGLDERLPVARRVLRPAGSPAAPAAARTHRRALRRPARSAPTSSTATTSRSSSSPPTMAYRSTEGEPIRGVSEGNQEQTMWTPLLIKAPGQDAAAIDERPAPERRPAADGGRPHRRDAAVVGRRHLGGRSRRRPRRRPPPHLSLEGLLRPRAVPGRGLLTRRRTRTVRRPARRRTLARPSRGRPAPLRVRPATARSSVATSTSSTSASPSRSPARSAIPTPRSSPTPSTSTSTTSTCRPTCCRPTSAASSMPTTRST